MPRLVPRQLSQPSCPSGFRPSTFTDECKGENALSSTHKLKMHCCTYDGKAITNSKSADSRRRIKLPKEATTKPKFAVKFELWPLKDKRGSSKAEKICAEKILVEHGSKQFHFNDDDIQPLEFFIEHMSGSLQ
jgi:hypothetical protein